MRVIIVPDMVHGIALTLRLLEIIGLDAPKISLGRWHPFQELVTTIASNTGQNPRRNAKSLLGCPSALPGGMPGFSMAWFQTPRASSDSVLLSTLLRGSHQLMYG